MTLPERPRPEPDQPGNGRVGPSATLVAQHQRQARQSISANEAVGMAATAAARIARPLAASQALGRLFAAAAGQRHLGVFHGDAA